MYNNVFLNLCGKYWYCVMCYYNIPSAYHGLETLSKIQPIRGQE